MANSVFMRRAWIIVVVFAALFISVSWLSLSSILQLRGNARVINYVGIVRGATQRLVKKELQRYPDNALVARLDGIVDELLTGQGANQLIVLQDEVYLENMNQVRNKWEKLKKQIEVVRAGGDPYPLYHLSEEYFTLVDRTVSSAETFTERRVDRSIRILLGVNAVFIVMLGVGITYYLRTLSLRRRAEQLRYMAYNDAMTKLPNRAACEYELRAVARGGQGVVAVIVFDMNNLKLANDKLGHTGGDRLIADFAEIIGDAAREYGFVGRFGGDEFLAIFRDTDQEKVERYIALINEKIVSYNLLRIDELEKLSFAVGYRVGDIAETDVAVMLDDADREMYSVKRGMKENRD